MGPQQVVTVETRALADAMAFIARFESFRLQNSDFDEDRVDVSRQLVEALVEEMREGEPVCDHSVGICACGPRSTLQELEMALEGKTWCKECGGEGFITPGHTEEGFETCRRCDSKGIINVGVTG